VDSAALLGLLMIVKTKSESVPMLPVAGDEHTSQQIWLYTLLLVPATLLLVYPMHVSSMQSWRYPRRTLESFELIAEPI